MAAAILLLFGAVLVLGLYHVVTPTPLLVLDGDGLTYRPYPFVRRVVRWSEVERILDVTPPPPRSGPSGPSRSVNLWIGLRPEAQSAHRRKAIVKLRFSRLLIPMPRDAFLKLLRRYHHVD